MNLFKVSDTPPQAFMVVLGTLLSVVITIHTDHHNFPKDGACRIAWLVHRLEVA